MKLRADLHVNGGSRKLVLVAGENEKAEHLALKLAAYVLFWDESLIVDASARHPALLGQEFRPDLMGLDEAGAVRRWVECGNTSLNKVSKVLRRFPYARLCVLKEDPAKARRFREEASEHAADASRLEVLSWPEGGFAQWREKLEEKTEIVGEASPTSLNVVVNDQVYVADLRKT